MSEPSAPAVKTLFTHSRNLCFYTGCEEHLTDFRWQHSVNGEIAHIKGEHPGSARYDPNQSESDRQGIDNLILLCPKHHKLIDRLEPDAHSVERLCEMRDKHLSHEATVQWCSEQLVGFFVESALLDAAAIVAADQIRISNPLGAFAGNHDILDTGFRPVRVRTAADHAGLEDSANTGPSDGRAPLWIRDEPEGPDNAW